MTRRTCLLAAFTAAFASAAERRRVLVYTRNHTPDGKGYVHDNVKSSVGLIRRLGEENGFAVDQSDDPKVFTAENLKRYSAVIFSNSNNEAFENDVQRDAFRNYVESGGGFVGIHSATGSERSWPWFWAMAGGKFLRHPVMQKFTVRVKDANHPATRGLPASFEWEDECYYHDNLASDIKPLLVTDPARLNDPQKATYPGDRFGDSLPLSWYHNVGRGRAFYTGLGHKIEHYANPILTSNILGGILWAMGQ